MTNVQRADKIRAGSQKVEAAQDVVFAWLKKHIVTLPRSEASFLTEAEVCRATGVSRREERQRLGEPRGGFAQTTRARCTAALRNLGSSQFETVESGP